MFKFKYPFKNKRIFFDNASGVNPSSIHFEGEQAKEKLVEARKKVARVMHAQSADVYFAASTTEANNIFIKGILFGAFSRSEKAHVIYSKSDHSAITEVVENSKLLIGDALEVTYIIPDKIGKLKVEEILKNLQENTKLICFSYVSSELGTVQEVRKIVLAVREFWQQKIEEKNWNSGMPKIFIDATQAVKYESFDVGNLGVDGMSFGGSKIGVSGVATLYVRSGTKLFSIISGGGQEEGIRSGTENLAAISLFGNKLEEVRNVELVNKNRKYVFELRNYLISKILPNPPLKGEDNAKVQIEIFGDTKFKHNSYFENCAPHILLIRVPNILGEELLLRLDAKGVSVSTASACSILENSGSNFLKSIGEPLAAKETIRVSLSENNTKKEIDYFVKTLKDIVEKYAKL